MSYNGWANRETWNVWLWISNDEGLYYEMRDYVKSTPAPDYMGLMDYIGYGPGDETPDGVEWVSDALDYDELDAAVADEQNS